MLCVTSFFNKTLFKKNLQRFWPLWLAYSLIWFIILPLIQLSDLLYGHMELYNTRTVLEVGVVGGIAMGAIFGLLFAMAEFSYLTNSRATQGMHALSSRRETLYFTNYISGLFCQISTLAVTFALTALIMAFGFTLDLGAICSSFLICVLCIMFFYSFAVFCMMFSGQALAAPVFYGIFNFLSIAMEALLRTFSGSFLYGYYDSLNEMYTDFLCPIWMLADNVNIRALREGQKVFHESTGVTEFENIIVGYSVEGMELFVLYALAGIALAVLGLLLYRRRASEETGTTVAIPWARPIFKYGVAFCAAFSLGQLLYYLLFGNYVGSARLFLPGMLGCMIFASLLGFYAAEMLLKKRFNVFRTSLGGATAVVLAVVIIGVGMSLDPTGYERYTPDADKVGRVYVSFYSDGVDFYEDIYEEETIKALITAHEAIIAEKDKMIGYMTDGYGHTGDELLDDSYFHFSVRYYLENGREVRRSYSGGHILREELTDPTSFASAITAFLNTPEVSFARTLGRNFALEGLGDPTFTGGHIYGMYGNVTNHELDHELTAAQAREVHEALLLDYELGNASQVSAFYSKGNDRYISLELWYNYSYSVEKYPDAYADKPVAIAENGNAALHLSVRSEMKNTVALLKGYGLIPADF